MVRPVRHPVFRLGDLAAAAVIELVRHGLFAPEKLELGILTTRARGVTASPKERARRHLQSKVYPCTNAAESGLV